MTRKNNYRGRDNSRKNENAKEGRRRGLLTKLLVVILDDTGVPTMIWIGTAVTSLLVANLFSLSSSSLRIIYHFHQGRHHHRKSHDHDGSSLRRDRTYHQQSYRRPNVHRNTSSFTHRTHIRVAFLGNSIMFFNDCPRLLEQMLETTHENVTQNSCLRGGATLTSLWKHGNGMSNRFATVQARRHDPNRHDNPAFDIGAPTVPTLLHQEYWDFVVVNDNTQGPARNESLQQGLQVLQDKYVKAMAHSRHAIPIFLQTAAYRYRGIKGSHDLGTFDQFTDRLAHGYATYVNHLRPLVPSGDVRLAPVGEAYRYLYHHHRTLWRKLYSWDHYHPSPHGTWLQACVLYTAMTQSPPPTYHHSWWNQSRVMQPVDERPLPRPTTREAAELRLVACRVMNMEQECRRHRSPSLRATRHHVNNRTSYRTTTTTTHHRTSDRKIGALTN